MSDEKQCTKCKVSKPATTEFFSRKKSQKDGLNYHCKLCCSSYTKEWKSENPEYQKSWIEANRGAVRKQRAEYRSQNKEKIAAYMKTWAERNPTYWDDWNTKNVDKRRLSCANHHRRKMQSDPTFRISRSMSSLVKNVLKSQGKSKGGKSWSELVDYTPDQLRIHLERQFSPGMTWENYGQWHVDHILPVVSFNINEAGDDEFRACWSLGNLRPLWARENISKGGRIVSLL